MAVFNTARLRDVLVNGRIAAEAPAQEFVEELEEQIGEALSRYGTLDRMELIEARLLQAMAEAEARASEREARQARHLNQVVGIVLGGIALAVAIILGFG